MYKGSSAKNWRKNSLHYRIEGKICLKCKYLSINDLICKNCQSRKFKPFKFSGQAKLITWSVVEAAPSGFETFVPYIIAIVELSEGPRMTTQLVDAEPAKLKYGLKLKTVFRKVYVDGSDGIISYALKFTPL